MKHSEEKTAAPKPQSESVFRDDIREAVRVMQSGGVILYPTDTIWGIGCDACNEDAVRRVFEIKRRAEAKSVISLVDSEVKVEFYVRSVPDVAWQLWECSDEPLTLVLDGARNLASGVIASDGSVALRVTREAFSRQLCMRMKRAVVSTGLVHIMGEITTSCYVDIPKIAREVIRSIGYDRAKYGFDCDTCGIITNIDEQSGDIAMGVDNSYENKESGASDLDNGP